MENTLNLVFDKWNDDKTPKANSNEFFNGVGCMIDNMSYTFFYNNYKLYNIDQVSKQTDKKFYYAFDDAWLLDPILYNNILPINENVINYMKKYDNLYFLCVNEQEVEEISVLYKIDKMIKNLGLNAEKFYFVDNNYKIQKIKEILSLDIKVHTSHILSLLIKNITLKENINIKYIPNKNNPSLFLCQNNKARAHRISLLILLKKYNILDDVDWSLVKGNDNKCEDETEEHIVLTSLKNDISFFNDEFNYFYCGVTKYNNGVDKNNMVFNNENGNFEWIYSTIENTFENSYFNIITETLFYERVVHITEKSFKPFCYFQFPLFLASHHHIKYMKMNYDFDYFDDVIDHSYDNIVDNTDRLFKFVEEIKRIQENKDFFINFYKEKEERFIENNKKYMCLTNTYDVNFFNSLI